MQAYAPGEGDAIAPPDHRASFVQQMRAVPGAVAIICTAANGHRTGLAATAWNSLCADPPMLLVCVNRNASAHALIREAEAFSVNLLSTADAETVGIFSGQCGLAGGDRFVRGEWDQGVSGQPLFNRAVAAFECVLEAAHSYGTHDIFIGKVNHIRSGSAGSPLIFLNGTFCQPMPLEHHASGASANPSAHREMCAPGGPKDQVND